MLEMLFAVVALQHAVAAPAVVDITRTYKLFGAAAAVVRHRVPDDAICCVFFLHLIPVLLFIYSDTIYVSVSLSSAVACTASICLQSYTLKICLASLKITAMRGAKAGHSPPRRSSPGNTVPGIILQIRR